MNIKVQVHSHCYHRNGITGIGFYAVHFSYDCGGGDKGEGIATVDADDIERKDKYNPGTRVLMFGENGNINIHQTMRGDNFHQSLVEFIKEGYKRER